MPKEKKSCDYTFNGEVCHHEYFDTGVDIATDKPVGRCIFHAPIEIKKGSERLFWDAFETYIERVQKEYDEAGTEKAKRKIYVDCRGFIFPGTEHRFRGRIFRFTVDFSSAQFSGDAHFIAAEFCGEALFGNVTFSGNGVFKDIRFLSTARFQYAEFSKEARFEGVEFLGGTDFKLAKFSGPAYFGDAQFSGDTGYGTLDSADTEHVKLTRFSGNVEFNSAHFFDIAIFTRVKFSGTADFSRAAFESNANFRLARFKNNADFGRARFSGEADFAIVQFSGTANFERAGFGSAAVFYESRFGGQLNVKSTVFHRGAELLRSRVSHVIADASTEFGPSKLSDLAGGKDVLLDNIETTLAVVLNKTYGPNVISICEKSRFASYFEIRAPFASVGLSDSVFSELVIVDPGVPYTTVSISNTIFQDHVKVNGCKLVRLVNVHIGRRMTLFEMDITEAFFENTDLTRIDFIGCRLPKVPRPRYFFWTKKLEGLNSETVIFRREENAWKRFVIGLKNVIRPDDYTREQAYKLVNQYRAVTTNYEGLRRYGLAGAFYAGECEMRRVYGNWRDKIILSLFRAVSFYGEDYLTPFFLLVLILPLLTGIAYAFVGIPVGKGGDIFNLDWIPVWSHAGTYYFNWSTTWEILKGFFKCICAAYTTIAFIPTKVTLGLNLGPAFIAVLARIFGAIFLTTFLFALRRRFRR